MPLIRSLGRAAALVMAWCLCMPAIAAPPRILPRKPPVQAPPMGFNPWNAFQMASSEQRLLAVAEIMRKSGLRDAGYRYINIDDGWWLKRRADGRILVRTSMFPSAATGDGATSLRPFVDRLHAMGFKAGIYTDIGRNSCSQAWNGTGPNLPEGSQAEREIGSMDHQAQDMRLMFGEWDFDYIKVDACGIADFAAGRPAVKSGQYRAFDPIMLRGKPDPALNARVEALYANLKSAIDAARPNGDYVLSLCTWGEGGVDDWGYKYGRVWRSSADISANWASMLHNFDSAADHPEHTGPGHWNDPDMLELGNGDFDASHLTEARAHMSMWAMLAAPLLLGSDLTQWPQSLFDIAGNREVIAIDQDPLGRQGRVIAKSEATEILVKPLANGDAALALINRSAQAQTLTAGRAQLGMSGTTLHDLWTHEDSRFGDTLTVTLAAHETKLYRMH